MASAASGASMAVLVNTDTDRLLWICGSSMTGAQDTLSGPGTRLRMSLTAGAQITKLWRRPCRRSRSLQLPRRQRKVRPMRRITWLALLIAASLTGCASNPFEAYYQGTPDARALPEY